MSLTLTLSGCGSGAADRRGGTNTVDNVIEQQVKAEEEKRNEEASTGTSLVINDKTGEEKTEAAQVTTEAAQSAQSAAEAETEMTEAATEAATDIAQLSETVTEEYLGEPDPSVDVDLTVMSKDMVYATVYQMMMAPEEFVGKKIKADGLYTAGYYDLTDKWYHYCIIKDAQACCQQGIEFTWGDGSHDLSEFPEEGTEIEVIGTFRTYKDFEDDEIQYCELADATMTLVTKDTVN